MKTLLWMIALAAGTGLAAAQGTSAGTGAGATGPDTGAPRAGDSAKAKDFWTQHSKSGYMTKADAMTYKGPDGTNPDMQKVDADNDGRISEQEWKNYSDAGSMGKSGTSGATTK
jgi:hypothetical protein